MVRLKTVWKREFHVKYNICDNGAADKTLNRACCSSHARKLQGGPGMAASILRIDAAMPGPPWSFWAGKLEECCIGWCSETCRIERTCGCRTKILRNRAKLLKAILIVSLAFPICAPGVFHALERTGWILKESPKFTMVNGWNEREKDVSHCKTRTEAGGAANSLLALAPWVEVGTRKSGAKSSWSSSHYVFTAQ